MDYGSICSGVEAAGLAWEKLGWKAKFFAEVEPFPSAVLMHRFGATKPLRTLDPDSAESEKERKLRVTWQKQIAEFPSGGTVPNLGDFTKITKDDYEGKIELLVGGTPCQSYSLAGLRKGLSDPRGNLALEFVRLAYRTDVRWTVWENVPGVLSSGGGRDFASFLSLLCGWEVPVPEKGWGKSGIVTSAPGCFSLAWRICDSQYTRVPSFPRAIPQRRRRLFVVGYRSQPVGNPFDWQYPAAVLLDGEMRDRDNPPSRKTRQDSAISSIDGSAETGGLHRVSHTVRMREGCSGGGKGPLISTERSLTLATANDQTLVQWWDGSEKADTLTCTSNNQLMPDKKKLQCVIDMRQVDVQEEEVSPTLIATDYKGGKAVYEEPEVICYENHANDSRVTETDGVSPTITGRCGTGGNNLPLVQDVLGFIKNDAGGNQEGYWEEVFPTVRSQVIPAVAVKECFNISPCDANGTRADRPNGGLYVTKAEAGKTVTANGPGTETVVIESEVIALDGDKMAKAERKGGSGLGISEDGVMYTQTAKDVHAVAYQSPQGVDVYNQQITGDVAGTLTSASGEPNTSGPKVMSRATVRRLLPVECERLMGFPDNHTRIPWKGKPAEECPDAPRYKACGNSMCVNVMEWIGLRIQRVENYIKAKMSAGKAE